jgi:hypothetical protein
MNWWEISKSSAFCPLMRDTPSHLGSLGTKRAHILEKHENFGIGWTFGGGNVLQPSPGKMLLDSAFPFLAIAGQNRRNGAALPLLLSVALLL